MYDACNLGYFDLETQVLEPLENPFGPKLTETKSYAAVESALDAWFHEAEAASWKPPAEVKAAYASASIVGDDRVVFRTVNSNSVTVVSHRSRRAEQLEGKVTLRYRTGHFSASILVFTGLLRCGAQDLGFPVTSKPQPRTAADGLRSLGITDLSSSSLVAALRPSFEPWSWQSVKQRETV